jgi:hypothetical protein
MSLRALPNRTFSIACVWNETSRGGMRPSRAVSRRAG